MRDVEHPSLSRSPFHSPKPPDLLTGCLGLERPQSVLWPPSVLSRPPQYAPHSPLQIFEPSETSILHFWQKVEFFSRYFLYLFIYVCLKFEYSINYIFMYYCLNLDDLRFTEIQDPYIFKQLLQNFWKRHILFLQVFKLLRQTFCPRKLICLISQGTRNPYCSWHSLVSNATELNIKKYNILFLIFLPPFQEYSI